MSSLSSISFASIANIPENAGFATFFWHLLKTKQCVDVKFELPGPEEPMTFLAHKFVLSLWSPYFADMFFGTSQEVDTQADGITNIKLDKVDPKNFTAILKFMYGYHVASEILNRKNVLDMLKISTSLDIPHLTQSCHRFIGSVTLEASNVFDVLEAAKDMQNRNLTDRCLRFLQDNTKEVLASCDICKISPSMLHTLLDLPKLCLPGEFDLLLWVLAWGKNRFVENSEYSSTREALEEFLPKMMFVSLSNKEFTMLYQHQDGFFTDGEALSIFRNIGILGCTPLPSWYDKEHLVRKYKGKSTKGQEDE